LSQLQLVPNENRACRQFCLEFHTATSPHNQSATAAPIRSGFSHDIAVLQQ
jgi:hypothetical protein